MFFQREPRSLTIEIFTNIEQHFERKEFHHHFPIAYGLDYTLFK